MHTIPRGFAAALLAAWAGSFTPYALADGTDLIVADAYTSVKWGTIGGVTAYSFSHIYCNLGDTPAIVLQSGAPHPVVTTSLYRLKAGRLEQIGQGYGFHEYCAIQQAVCGTCTPEQTSCTLLGAGCSTTTGSSTAGAQQRLASRRYVNPATGEIAWPIPFFGMTGDALFKRLQVANNDLNPAMNSGATYFVESRIVSVDDGYYGNNLDNATCRPLVVGPLHEGGYVLSMAGSAVRRTTAIENWALADPSVLVSFADLDDPRERFALGAKATDLGDGTWAYEYALQNYSSVQGAGAFTVPLGGTAAASPGFHDVDYHSGDPFDPTDWSATISGSASITWASPQTWDENPDSNALRWGTTYNFRFISPSPPADGSATIGLFAPGARSSISIATIVPTAVPPPPCLGDGDFDGQVSFSDITAALSAWGAAYPDTTGFGDANHDSVVGFLDITTVLANWGAVCGE